MFLFELSSKNKQSQLNLNKRDVPKFTHQDMMRMIMSYVYEYDLLQMRRCSTKIKCYADDRINELENKQKIKRRLIFNVIEGKIWCNKHYFQHFDIERSTWSPNSDTETRLETSSTCFHNPIDIYLKCLALRQRFSVFPLSKTMISQPLYFNNQKITTEKTIINYIKHYYLSLGTKKHTQFVNITYAETDNNLQTQLLESNVLMLKKNNIHYNSNEISEMISDYRQKKINGCTLSFYTQQESSKFEHFSGRRTAPFSGIANLHFIQIKNDENMNIKEIQKKIQLAKRYYSYDVSIVFYACNKDYDHWSEKLTSIEYNIVAIFPPTALDFLKSKLLYVDSDNKGSLGYQRITDEDVEAIDKLENANSIREFLLYLFSPKLSTKTANVSQLANKCLELLRDPKNRQLDELRTVFDTIRKMRYYGLEGSLDGYDKNNKYEHKMSEYYKK
ncbi:hypothetical protein [Cysteiniphilum litorale]|uniref:hypothetical protein n=1 Tax=Cysteiniphilum litorale TaxID=2056700 RepID=UPI003F8838F8